MAKTKSKLFRVFVEGNTISDGRQITPEMIDSCVETFNSENYSPRINVEHVSGFSPEPPFNGYGDAIALEARDDKFTIGGKTETRRALYAQVEANDQLVELAGKDQKPFPSVELTDSYAGTGKIGMVGLAFTDTAASIGTQRLQFSRSAPGTVFTKPDGDAPEIEFETPRQDAQRVADAINTGFAGLFARMFAKEKPEEKPREQTPPVPANDNDFSAFASALAQETAKQVNAALKPVIEAQARTDSEFADLKKRLEGEESPQNFKRGPATGTGERILTDC